MPSECLWKCCHSWIQKNGYDSAVSAAVDSWRNGVYGGCGKDVLRKRIDWVMWCDTTAKIDEKICWSACIQKDLRKMRGAERTAWIELLSNVGPDKFSGVCKPMKKWLGVAGTVLKNVGMENFQRYACAWFELFQPVKPELRITITGRDLLLALFWYSQLVKHPKLDEAVFWFATAKWKTKVDIGRTAMVLPVWIYTMKERKPEGAIDAIHTYEGGGQLKLMGQSLKMYEELCQRYGVTPKAKSMALPSREEVIAAAEAASQKRIHKINKSQATECFRVEGDLLVVNDGRADRYHIGLRDGRIQRLADGKKVWLDIDWSWPDFQAFRVTLDELDLRYPLEPNYFRALFCARILLGQTGQNVPVLVDET